VCAGHCLVKELGGGLFYLDQTELEYTVDGSVRNLMGNVIMTSNFERVKSFCERYKNSGITLDY
jgi:hypothetical protein